MAGTLGRYLEETVAKLEKSKIDTEVYKTKVVPSVVESIIRLSSGAPEDVRNDLKSALGKYKSPCCYAEALKPLPGQHDLVATLKHCIKVIEPALEIEVELAMGSSQEPFQVKARTLMTIRTLKETLTDHFRTPVSYQKLLSADDETVLLDHQTIGDIVGRKVKIVRGSPEQSLWEIVLGDTTQSYGGSQSLHSLAPDERNLLLRYLLEFGMDDPNAIVPKNLDSAGQFCGILPGTGATLLHWAVSTGDVDLCEIVLGDDRFNAVNAMFTVDNMVRCYASFSCHGASALHLAAMNNHGIICDLLLNDPRIEVNAKSEGGYTALHWAVAQRSPEACDALLQHNGFDVDAVDDAGVSALQLAIYCCMPEEKKFDTTGLILLHALTDDGMCWSSSGRISCRDKAEAVCELFVRSGRCSMSSTQSKEFDLAREALASDKLKP